MALRLGGLADLDPASVPLPPGTEVVTRVDRDVDGELRLQGATGRVAKLDGDRVEIAFVDGKHATYLRSEVTPRRLGVARYAQRRAAAWDQLRACIAIDTLVGSRAWGVADEGSDEDRRGVFVSQLPWTTGLVDPPLDLISVDGRRRTGWQGDPASTARRPEHARDAVRIAGDRRSDRRAAHAAASRTTM